VTALADLRDRLVGLRFPPGHLRVQGYESWLSADCFAEPLAPGDELHPAWVLVGGLRDMGVPFEELFELAEARVEHGIFYGEATITQEEPLRVGVDYDVEGVVLDLVRREGARLGTFDLLTFELRLVARGGSLAAVATSTFVFGRKS
jgi:hypothetical protein